MGGRMEGNGRLDGEKEIRGVGGKIEGIKAGK
jgi:hypothetical protein